MLTRALLDFTLIGAEWVLWLLLILSVASVALMIERTAYFLGRSPRLDQRTPHVDPLVVLGPVPGARQELRRVRQAVLAERALDLGSTPVSVGTQRRPPVIPLGTLLGPPRFRPPHRRGVGPPCLIDAQPRGQVGQGCLA